MNKPVRVLIADDHVALRVGVKHILREGFPGVHFGEVGSVTEVLQVLKQGEWDLLILEINLPGRNGFDILSEISAINRDLKVLVFSCHRAEQMAVRCMRAGALGFLHKSASESELVGAIQQILGGQKYISKGVAQLLSEHVRKPTDLYPHEYLSDREYQILLKIGNGQSISEIADELSLSVNTINTYRARILSKMDLRNTAMMIRYVVENELG